MLLLSRVHFTFMDFTFQWEWAYLLPLDASRDPVEFKDWAVLPIPDHGGLDHLSESRLFGRGHQEGPEGVDVPWTHCRCRGWLVRSPSWVPSNSWLTATGSTAFSYALERWYAICRVHVLFRDHLPRPCFWRPFYSEVIYLDFQL